MLLRGEAARSGHVEDSRTAGALSYFGRRDRASSRHRRATSTYPWRMRSGYWGAPAASRSHSAALTSYSRARSSLCTT